MTAEEIMQHSVLTASPEMSLALASRLMEDHRIRHLPVVSSGCLIGLVTDRDIRSASPPSAELSTQAEIVLYMGTTAVKNVMMQDVVTIRPKTDVVLATRKMLDGHFGCLPVLDQDQLVGLITEIDLLRGYLAATRPNDNPIDVKDAMQDLLITLVPEDLVSTAYQRMQGGIVRHLPVLDDDGKLVGVITDRDIRRVGNFGEEVSERANRFGMMMVTDLMTTQIVTVRNHTGLTEAAELFLTHKFGCLPIIRDDGTLEGILTVADLLRRYIDQSDSGRAKL